MRKIHPFKIFIKSNFSLKHFPLRLLNFKRQKWSITQKNLRRVIKPQSWKKSRKGFKKPFQLQLVNPMLIRLPRSRWTRGRRAYSNELVTKRLLYILYQRALKPEFFRIQIKAGLDMPSRTHVMLIKPYFRTDILLRFLNFFCSVYHAKQFFTRGKFMINNKVVKKSSFLTGGDLVQLKKTSRIHGFLSALRQKHSKKAKLLPFVMVDYYTKAVIILTNHESLGCHDVALMSEPKINFRSFKYLF